MSDKSEAKLFLSPMAGVVLPGLQAGITGLAVGVVSGSLAYTQGADPVGWGAVGAGVGFALAWGAGLSWWRARLSGQSSQLVSQPVTAYEQVTDVIRIELAEQGGRWVDFLDLGVSKQALLAVACELDRGKEFTLADLGGRGKCLSRAEFEHLRGELIARGLAAWASIHSHNRGAELTGSGRAFMRRLVQEAIIQGIYERPTHLDPRHAFPEQHALRLMQTRADTRTLPGVYPAGLVQQADETDELDELWN